MTPDGADTVADTHGGPPSQRAPWALISTLGAFTTLAALYLGSGAGRERFIDPDAWHQMALIREALSLGYLPRTDPFSFTSSVEPLVHHEWGMGVWLYWVGTTFGAFGLGVLRDLLSLGIGAACIACARRRGTSCPVLWATAPVAIFLLWTGFSTVRAQMFTLFFLAVLLWFLELDRDGRRWWAYPWLFIHLLWVNMHAGFVVGGIAFACYLVDRAIHREPIKHLFVIGAAMVALVALNPYGLSYFAYLWHGLTLDRELIGEWQPIWSMWWPLLAVFAMSLVLALYAIVRSRLGWKDLATCLFLFATVYAAIRHQRHLSLYAVAWAAFIPPLIQQTPLAALLNRLLSPSRPRMAIMASALAVTSVAWYGTQRVWVPTIPANPGEHPSLLYPVGAVDYLKEVEFQGSLISPFEVGAFVSWRSFPDVLVSMDGRFEVAYEPALLADHQRFYRAESSWQGFLRAHVPDAVLARISAPVADSLTIDDGWEAAYEDDVYAVFVPSDHGLPRVDRRGVRLSTAFPD